MYRLGPVLKRSFSNKPWSSTTPLNGPSVPRANPIAEQVQNQPQTVFVRTPLFNRKHYLIERFNRNWRQGWSWAKSNPAPSFGGMFGTAFLVGGVVGGCHAVAKPPTSGISELDRAVDGCIKGAFIGLTFPVSLPIVTTIWYRNKITKEPKLILKKRK